MRKTRLWAAALLVLVLCACSRTAKELPEPAALLVQLTEAVDLPEMVDVAEELLEMNTGITPEEYESAVYCVLEADLAPDELIIVRARDSHAAASVQEKLQDWLDHRVEDAQCYLTENMPLLQAGVVRRDGLTVSLIVSDQAEATAAFYDSLS